MLKKKTNNTNPYTRQIVKALLIGVSVVFFWRGAWGLMDIYLFPNDLTLSYVFSLVVGIGVLCATHYIVKELI